MEILISHLTRMRYPRICVAGVELSENRHQRPISEDRKVDIDRSMLSSQGGVFGLGVEVDLGEVRPIPNPPETEDVRVDIGQVRPLRQLAPEEFWEVMSGYAQDGLVDIFGDELEVFKLKAGVSEGKGSSSLGVLRPQSARLTVDGIDGKQQVRLLFTDPSLGKISASVTDLRIWEESMASYQERPRYETMQWLEDKLDNCLLAVGLSRAFSSSEKYPPRHWLQINNIFPVKNPLWE